MLTSTRVMLTATPRLMLTRTPVMLASARRVLTTTRMMLTSAFAFASRLVVLPSTPRLMMLTPTRRVPALTTAGLRGALLEAARSGVQRPTQTRITLTAVSTLTAQRVAEHVAEPLLAITHRVTERVIEAQVAAATQWVVKTQAAVQRRSGLVRELVHISPLL